MSKIAYTIVSDLHLYYRNKRNRSAYLDEGTEILRSIERIGQNYIAKGFTPYLLLLGDISDNSFKGTVAPVHFNNEFIRLKKTFNQIYSVVGNHETSYYKDNPFWSLFTEIPSNRMKHGINSTWIPQGVLQIVNIVDELHDGEVHLYFNHYNAGIIHPNTSGVNIGLFHKNIVPKEITQIMKTSYGLDVWDDAYGSFKPSTELRGYNICFFGHNHKAYGKFKWVSDFNSEEQMTLYYLASLLRPNHTEVQDNFLERNIPAVIVEDGVFKTVENNLISLRKRSDSVKETVVLLEQEQRKILKSRREQFQHLAETDNPIENIRTALSRDPKALSLFESILANDDADTVALLKRKELCMDV